MDIISYTKAKKAGDKADSVQEQVDQIERDGISPKDGSVTPKTTTFAKSKNLAGVLVVDFGLSGPVGNIRFTDTEGAGSYITKLEKGKTYTVSKSESDRFRIVTNAGYPVVGDVSTRSFQFNDNDKEFTVTLEGDEDHLIAYVSSSEGDPPTQFQIEEGVYATEYTEPGKKVSIDFGDKVIPPSALRNVSESLKTTGILIGIDTAFDVSIEDEIVTTSRAGGYAYIDNERYQLIDGVWDFDTISTNSVFVGINKDDSSVVFYPSNDIVDDKVALLGVIRKDRGTCFINGLHTFEGKQVKPFTGDIGLEEVEKIDRKLGEVTSSKNLFEGDIRNMSISGPITGGDFRELEGSESYVTKLSVGNIYTISKSESDRFRIATSPDNPSVGNNVGRYLAMIDNE